jgi:hypothetical protein
VRPHGAGEWLTPVAQQCDEKAAGEGPDVVPGGIRGQGVGPLGGPAVGVDLADAAAEGLKVAQVLGFEGSAVRESFGYEAGELVQEAATWLRTATLALLGVGPRNP